MSGALVPRHWHIQFEAGILKVEPQISHSSIDIRLTLRQDVKYKIYLAEQNNRINIGSLLYACYHVLPILSQDLYEVDHIPILQTEVHRLIMYPFSLSS